MEAILHCVGKSAKRKRFLQRLDGTDFCISQVDTTVEKYIAHAIGVANRFPDEQKRRLVKSLLDLTVSRIVNGKRVLNDVSEIIRASLEYDGVDANRTALMDAALHSFEDPTKDYEELDEIIALHDFINVVPDVVSTVLIERVKAKLKEEADIIFDEDISKADDDNDIKQLRTMARGIAQTFGVDLHLIHERLKEQEEEIQARNEEIEDDSYEERDRAISDASDSEIVAMFGGLAE